MKPTAEKLEIIKWITELEDQSTIQQLKSFKERYSSAQRVWWDTYSISVSHSDNNNLEDSEKHNYPPYTSKMSGKEFWF